MRPGGRWMPRSARWAPRWRSRVRVTHSGGWTTTIRWRWRGGRTGRPRGLRHPVGGNPGVAVDVRPGDWRWWAEDAASCALGTRLGVAGWRDGFRRVDHDYPVAVAQLARGQGARTFVLTSAMGADARSSVFYNRVKGELEEAIAALDFPALVLVRPGLIDGERSERRPAEAAALVVSRALRPLLRSEERRVGQACVSTCRSRWSQY